MTACMIYITTSSPEEARKLAKTLLEEQLAACANIIDGVASFYRWNGSIESDSESLVIAKTIISKRRLVIERISGLHSYTTPCVVSYDIADGQPDYLSWIQSEVGAITE
ncbi:MAG: divalent-cation tolerance protein CutA [Rhodospirillaceae bacterium]